MTPTTVISKKSTLALPPNLPPMDDDTVTLSITSPPHTPTGSLSLSPSSNSPITRRIYHAHSLPAIRDPSME